MQAVNIEGKDISRVFLIDDDPSVRDLYQFHLDDVHVETEKVVSISGMDQLLQASNDHDGFVCDFHLNNSRYSPINGDVIVSGLYQKKIPAVLCSRDVDTVSSVRRLRHSIPCIIEARDLNVDSIMQSFATCIREFSGNFSKERRPWPTLIRIENIVQRSPTFLRVAVVIPGWEPQSIVEVDILKAEVGLCADIIKAIDGGDVFRCKAQVNLDSESQRDVYVKDWVLI
jgi:hypothetical protein